MSAKKLTPLEILQRRKKRLQIKSDELTGSLEGNLEYLQQHLGTLVGASAMDAVVSKTPPFVQDFLGRGKYSGKWKETGSFNRMALLEGALDLLPFFIKGTKGWIASLVLDQAKKWFFRRK